MLPELRLHNGKKVLYVEGRPFYLLAGEVHNSASSTRESLAPVMDRLASLKLNTALVPVSWQLIEPEEGCFDFSMVELCLSEARRTGLRLGLLWFGSWKNAQCSYAPEWVKRDDKRFFRAQLKPGQPLFLRRAGLLKLPYTTISPFCEEACRADARAFAALMSYLREHDPEHTVITVQVENETGFLGGDMDYRPEALALFEQTVPEELTKGLRAQREALIPGLRRQLDKGLQGDWSRVFGRYAHEVFIAYYTARYVNTVAEAGLRELALPTSSNCWLNTTLRTRPGKYPCGGPVAKMSAVWRIAAPSVDFHAPDIYLDNFLEVCGDFDRASGSVYVPESKACDLSLGRSLYLVGRHHAACYSTFGTEDIGNGAPDLGRFGFLMGFASGHKKDGPLEPSLYARLNELLCGAMPVLAPFYGSGRLDAFCREAGRGRERIAVERCFGDVSLRAVYLPVGPVKNGGLLFARLSEDELLVIGTGLMLTLRSAVRNKPCYENLRIEEGRFENGCWVKSRVLNGDEEMLLLQEPTALRIRYRLFE